MDFENLKQQLYNLLQSEMNERNFIEAAYKILHEKASESPLDLETSDLQKLVRDSFTNKLKGNKLTEQIDTGFSTFNKNSGGFYLGDFIFFAGRPAMGTTQLMVNLALNISKTYQTLFLTYNLSPLLLQERLVSCLTKLPLYKLLDHEKSEGIKKFEAIQSELQSQKLFISEKGNESADHLENIIENHILEKGVRVIFIDKMKNLARPQVSHEKRNTINLISNKLKEIAQKHKVLIIATGNVSKSAEFRGGPRKPYLEDLENGDILESLADKIILLYQPGYYGIIENEIGEPIEFQLELKIVKNNRGSIRSTYVYRDDYFTHFTEEVNLGMFQKSKDLLSSLDNIHFDKNGFLKYK